MRLRLPTQPAGRPWLRLLRPARLQCEIARDRPRSPYAPPLLGCACCGLPGHTSPHALVCSRKNTTPGPDAQDRPSRLDRQQRQSEVCPPGTPETLPRPCPEPSRSLPRETHSRSWAARVREKGLSTCDPSSMNQPARLPHSLTRRPTPSRHRLWTTQQLACPQVASSRLAAARPASATLSTSLATASKTTSSDCSPAEISRDHLSSPEITRDHPRWDRGAVPAGEITRDYPRLGRRPARVVVCMIYFLDVHGRGSWADCFLKATCSVQSHLGQGHARASRPGRGTFSTHARGASTQTCGETADTAQSTGPPSSELVS